MLLIATMPTYFEIGQVEEILCLSRVTAKDEEMKS
jgi:hypothetical protein